MRTVRIKNRYANKSADNWHGIRLAHSDNILQLQLFVCTSISNPYAANPDPKPGTVIDEKKLKNIFLSKFRIGFKKPQFTHNSIFASMKKRWRKFNSSVHKNFLIFSSFMGYLPSRFNIVLLRTSTCMLDHRKGTAGSRLKSYLKFEGWSDSNDNYVRARILRWVGCRVRTVFLLTRILTIFWRSFFWQK
jgi:hypothetical protein